MKNFLRITVTAVLITALLFSTAFAGAPVDIQRHWAGNNINTLISKSILTGYPDGRFKPDNYVTRQEIATIINKTINAEFPHKSFVSQSSGSFADIRNSWAAKDIEALVAKGVLTPYFGEPFRPFANSTREEAADLIFKMLKWVELNSVNNRNNNNNNNNNNENNNNISSNNTFTNDIMGNTTTTAINNSNSNSNSNINNIDNSDNSDNSDVNNSNNNDSDNSDVSSSNSNDTDGTNKNFTDSPTKNLNNDGRDNKKVNEFTNKNLNNSGVNLPTDISASPYYEEIKMLYSKGILKGTPGGTFNPKSPVTRGEFAVMFQRAMGFSTIPLVKTLPPVKTIAVPYISQLWPVSAPVGCEGTSLLMGLKAKGYAGNVTLKQFLDAMPKTFSDPSKGFVGSPYIPDRTKRTRTTIFPGKLTEFGRRYGKVLDFTGANLNQIQSEVLAGNPVVVYMTMYYQKPFYRYYNVEGVTKRFLSNNHVVLLAGYDSIKNNYYIVDPYNKKRPSKPYLYWLPSYTFEKIYKERNHAVVIE